MSETGRVRLDTTNLMADVLGSDAHGLTQEEIDSLAPAVVAGHDHCMKMRADGVIGFYDLPDDRETADRIVDVATKVKHRFKNVAVLGIGGSSLGTIAAASALLHPYHNLDASVRNGHPRLFVMDNIDPTTLAGLFDVVGIAETLFVVITKSGSTAETMGQFAIVAAKLQAVLGDDYRENIIVITDPEAGDLRKLAREEKFVAFDVPPNVGGRFSVLSAVGLVPSALVGIDIHGMLAGAADMRERTSKPDLSSNVAYLYAATQYLLAATKGMPISVMMPYSDRLFKIADWFRQLWAESLGKAHDRRGKVVNVGPTPVNALGATDQHSQIQLYAEGPFDKVITFLAVADGARDVSYEVPYKDTAAIAYFEGRTMGELLEAERRGTAVAVTAAGKPNATLLVSDVSAASLGALFFMLESATALSGELYGIDAFNQPGVEAGKTAAYALMGRPGYEDRLAEITDLDSRDGKRITG